MPVYVQDSIRNYRTNEGGRVFLQERTRPTAAPGSGERYEMSISNFHTIMSYKPVANASEYMGKLAAGAK
jgi:hypothetical protein